MKKLSKYFIPTLMIIMAIAIIFAAVNFKQAFWRISPLFISLTIGFLQSKASRFHPLMGGINSILYCAVYFSYGLYGMAVYALLVSCPIQLVTFALWKRKAWNDTTLFRKLSVKNRVLLTFAFLVVLALTQFVLKQFNSNYALLDSTVTLLGVACSFLTMFAFIEYTWLMVLNGIISIVLYLVVIKDSPEQTTYLIFSVYSFICQVVGFFKVRNIYKQQQ